MWSFIIPVIAAIWVVIDGLQRKLRIKAIIWSIATLIIGVLTLPIYLATRPLKAGESREGGTAWNILRNFALFWTIFLVIVTLSWLVAMNGTTPATNSDWEQAGRAIGTTLGLGLMCGLWFLPMLAALVIGFFLKSSRVEQGPTGSLLAYQQALEQTASTSPLSPPPADIATSVPDWLSSTPQVKSPQREPTQQPIPDWAASLRTISTAPAPAPVANKGGMNRQQWFIIGVMGFATFATFGCLVVVLVVSLSRTTSVDQSASLNSGPLQTVAMPTSVATETDTPIPTNTAQPTATPKPTSAPKATSTLVIAPQPTAAAIATNTLVIAPQPNVASGARVNLELGSYAVSESVIKGKEFFVGEVINNGDTPASNVQIALSLLDSSGNVIAADSTNAAAVLVAPAHGKFPFVFLVDAEPGQWKSANFQNPWRRVRRRSNFPPYLDLRIEKVSGLAPKSGYGGYSLAGQIVNTGTKGMSWSM